MNLINAHVEEKNILYRCNLIEDASEAEDGEAVSLEVTLEKSCIITWRVCRFKGEDAINPFPTYRYELLFLNGLFEKDRALEQAVTTGLFLKESRDKKKRQSEK